VTRLTHLDANGKAQMVDVSDKTAAVREATAIGKICLKPETIELLYSGGLPKGDALGVARIAAIQAAKKTSDLIPLCHPLMIDKVEVEFTQEPDAVVLKAVVRCSGKTGVEMEALTAVSVGLLALYDMVKAVERSAQIQGIGLVEKRGGKTGHWTASSS
jgi:cyclic pyranopterin phosphate synthase